MKESSSKQNQPAILLYETEQENFTTLLQYKTPTSKKPVHCILMGPSLTQRIYDFKANN